MADHDDILRKVRALFQSVQSVPRDLVSDKVRAKNALAHGAKPKADYVRKINELSGQLAMRDRILYWLDDLIKVAKTEERDARILREHTY